MRMNKSAILSIGDAILATPPLGSILEVILMIRRQQAAILT
jgi:hypothetical protein